MRHDFIDRYSRVESPIHRVSPQVKTFGMFAGVLATIITPVHYWMVFAAIIVLYSVVLIVSTIPSIFILKRLLMAEPFVIGVALLTLLKPDGGATFLTVVLKSSLSVFGLILYSNTTPFSDVLRLLRQGKFPGLLITVLALMYRYLFVLIDETERMQRARASRTFKANRSHVWQMGSSIIAQLFVRSTERAERIYAAMRARGWK
jgi:cobalt/nickel transport system permease protein